jgi:adenosylcobinamide-phosphate synthase
MQSAQTIAGLCIPSATPPRAVSPSHQAGIFLLAVQPINFPARYRRNVLSFPSLTHGERMSFFSLALALLAQYLRPYLGDNPFQAVSHRLAVFFEQHFNAGQRHYGVLAWALASLTLLLPVVVIYSLIAGMGSPGKLAALGINAAVLYFTLRFRSASLELRGVQLALQRDDIDDARAKLGRYLGRSVVLYERDELTRVTVEQILLSAHRDLFGPILWFLVLPGPLGPLLYVLVRELAAVWHKPELSADGAGASAPFGHFAQQAWKWMDWIPARATALSFGIAGDFQDAMECWRAQAHAWMNPQEGIVLTSGAGALGVRLGQPLTTLSGADYRPEIGMGEAAVADFAESAEGLVWRALALWLAVLVLVTLASAVTWLKAIL